MIFSMGVTILPSSLELTPICNECGICLCWDISFYEYIENKSFWDNWICEVCNGGTPLSLKQYIENKKK